MLESIGKIYQPSSREASGDNEGRPKVQVSPANALEVHQATVIIVAMKRKRGDEGERRKTAPQDG